MGRRGVGRDDHVARDARCADTGGAARPSPLLRTDADGLRGAGTRTYLNIPHGRDRGYFGAGLGAEDAVYFMYTRTKVTTPCAEIARSRRVAAQKRGSALLPSLPSLQAWLRRDA